MQTMTDAVANSHQIEQVRHRLELWRREHAGRRPLPPEMWSEAAQLAQQYGVYRIAKASELRLAEATFAGACCPGPKAEKDAGKICGTASVELGHAA